MAETPNNEIPSNDTPSKKSGWLRLSLREAFLAITALSALLAVYMANSRSIPTRFLAALDEQAELEAICRDEGLKLLSPASGIGAGGSSPWEANRKTSFFITSPTASEFRTQVMPKFRDRVAMMIEEGGCTVTGTEKGGADNFTELHDFTFRYQTGATRGIFRADSTELPDGRLKLLILVDEF